MLKGRQVVSYSPDTGEYRVLLTAFVSDGGRALRMGPPADLAQFEVVGGQRPSDGEAFLEALDEMNPRCNGIAYGAPCVVDWQRTRESS